MELRQEAFHLLRQLFQQHTAQWQHADKRRRFVFLTAEGEALLESSKPIGNEVDEAFLGRLNGAEREQFSGLIKKMMQG